MLNHIGEFTKTLQKIYTFVDAQKDTNRIKSFLRQGETGILLKDCQEGLKQAMAVFKVESGLTILRDIGAMQQAADDMHRELLQLISNLSDDGSSMVASSAYTRLNGSGYQARYQTSIVTVLRYLNVIGSSSNSLFILPSKPQIFHGRQAELEHVVTVLNREFARIAILGPGGIGKTSLARAVMHHPDVVAKYKSRYYVPCDSASTSLEIAAAIAAYLELKPGRDLRKPVLQSLGKRPSALLILDNLETAWDPMDSRSDIEEFLSQLTNLPQMALMITMRGAERPAKVEWTRPFLQPLAPLSPEAARQTFEDIADNFHDPTIVNQLLSLTDNIPLAVSLIAHLVDYEDSSSVLTRWNTEKTSMLSAGNSRGSNMDASIRISLSSPRLTLPGAMDLLGLLSLLPDGLSDVDLIQSQLPIESILACKEKRFTSPNCLGYNPSQNTLEHLRLVACQRPHPSSPSLSWLVLSHRRIAAFLAPTRRVYTMHGHLHSSGDLRKSGNAIPARTNAYGSKPRHTRAALRTPRPAFAPRADMLNSGHVRTQWPHRLASAARLQMHDAGGMDTERGVCTTKTAAATVWACTLLQASALRERRRCCRDAGIPYVVAIIAMGVLGTGGDGYRAKGRIRDERKVD
ncbi:hypothetical protein MSAN_01581000 [Mycena sanguinolenta]|uniref:Novel STAND NTPase 1 domain-containing protein n=1 Tax=Mycena sanguinolenta TaxID=230812 RepID=A0A8H6Y487_9AGAR|nr:hypothetical protein MSAN_01581000 [Mycena sanguinolenta]